MTDAAQIEYNRLGLFWRPIVDMTHSELAPMRLRMIKPVAAWIADPQPGRVSWFSRIGVEGLRRQVLRHAGLEQYECVRPQDLPAELRTPAWQGLIDALDEFANLDDYLRGLVVFQLAQLSFCQYAVGLTGLVRPTGVPGRDYYAYQVARVHARLPRRAGQAIPVFETLAARASDPLLALLACFQGIGHGIRRQSDIDPVFRLEEIGRGLGAALPESWHAHLTRSRFHRALALLRLKGMCSGEVRRELQTAWHHHNRLADATLDDISILLAGENERYLLEAEIEAARRGPGASAEQVRAYTEALSRLDPNCVETRLTVGDGCAIAGDYAAAAGWYARAGELGTASGATGWYRAAQCYDHLGAHTDAINAMGHCLELDTTAIEPQQYLIARMLT